MRRLVVGQHLVVIVRTGRLVHVADGDAQGAGHRKLQQVGKSSVDTDVETGQKILRLTDMLDDNDDVQNVYTNLNATDAMVAEA